MPDVPDPFAAPADRRSPSTGRTDREAFPDPHRRARFAAGTLLAVAAAEILLLVVELAEYSSGLSAQPGLAVPPARAALYLVLAMAMVFAGLAQTIASITSVVAFCMWIHRANRAARALGADLLTTPGWAVGWFFVPIASLWKPYQAVAEIWRQSDTEGDHNPLPLWWGLFLLNNLVANVSLRMTIADPTAGGPTVVAVSVLSSATGFVAAFAAVDMIRRLDRHQRDRALRLGLLPEDPVRGPYSPRGR